MCIWNITFTICVFPYAKPTLNASLLQNKFTILLSKRSSYEACPESIRPFLISRDLENWSPGLDVTWQPVRGDLTGHL